MQPQPLNDCEVGVTLNNAHLRTESFAGFVVGFGVLFLSFFFSAVVLYNFLNFLTES